MQMPSDHSAAAAGGLPDPAGQTGPRRPGRRRMLIATPVTERVARMVTRTGAAVLAPELASRPADLSAALLTHRPHTLVVGANKVPGEAIERWATAMRRDADPRRLLVIRRGTSLAEIDLAAAAAHGVTVRNTPEVNARHVARFMAEHLFAGLGPGDAPLTVGLVGAGDINSRLAREAVLRGHDLVVHSPSLAARPDALDRWLAARKIPAGRIQVARDVPSVFDIADLVGMAVPLTVDGPHPTAGMVDAKLIERFGGRRIVSVCEPEVFTHDALLAAYERDDLEVVLDNAPRLLAPVRAMLAGRGRQADDSAGSTPPAGSPAGDPAGKAAGKAAAAAAAAAAGSAGGEDGWLRPGFTLLSAAMRMPGCAEDLDQAFLAVAAQAELEDPQPAAPAAARQPAAAPRPDVVVVGGGIVGLTIALELHRQGRRVEVLDAAPADRDRVDEQGTTFGGTNGRHLSTTETLPHADGRRAGILDRPLAEGGWRLREPASLSAAEAAWAAAFERFTDRPGMHAVTTDLVIGLNRLGLRGWEELFDAYPDDIGSARRDARLVRLYLSDADLADGRRLQSRANGLVRELTRADLAADWPALGTSVRLPGATRTVSGALEVDGYAVNIHDLADAIAGRLRAGGVTIRPDSRVDRIDPGDGEVRLALADGSLVRAGSAVLTVGGTELHRLLGDVWPAAAAVSHVLGVSLTLPNPGLRRALKVHASDPLGVINVTLSPDGSLIHVSGGFGYLGLASWRSGQLRPARPGGPAEAGAPDGAGIRPGWTEQAVAALLEAFTRATGDLFPALRGPDGRLDIRQVRTCERPMTPDGLPIVEALDEFGGRLIVAAGTNAGGAVEAPALGRLVGELLDGRAGCAHLAMAGDRVGLPLPAGQAVRCYA